MALLGEASIVIDQATLGPGTAGRARNDGVLAQIVTLRNNDNTNVKRWEWLLLVPRGSAAALNSLTAASVQFTPDVDGTYLVMLLVNEGKAAIQKSRTLFAVKSAGGYRFPAQGESNEANWPSIYTNIANETGWWEDITEILRANEAVFTGSILTVLQEPNLGASRRLIAGAGVAFDDGGGQGDFKISVAPGYSGVESLSDVGGQPENLRSTRLTNPATRDATKYGQVALGSGGTTGGNYAVVVGGRNCTASGIYSNVLGGNTNGASGSYTTVVGGITNSATKDFSFIGGGDSNQATRDLAVIGGGTGNLVSQDQGTIGGGNGNTVSGLAGVVAGGVGNTASGTDAAVGGGLTNSASGTTSVVAGGTLNQATNTSTTVGGGTSNTASAAHATVAGGNSNTVNAAHGTVGGGQTNAVSAAHGTIGGGQGNSVTVAHGTVGGGSSNSAVGVAVVAGGTGNAASGTRSAVGGGTGNTASGDSSMVGGGNGNTASGDYAAVLGGRSGIASALDSVAIGRAAQAANTGAMVLKDGNTTAVSSSATHQLTMSFTGGIREFVVGGTWRRSGYSSTTNHHDTYHGMANTTGATAVNLDIIAIPTGQTVYIRGHIIGKKNTTSDAIRRIYDNSVINVGGVITAMTAQTDTAVTNAGGNLYTATVGVHSTNIRITYAGVAATTVYWTWSFEFWFGGGP